jgi:hypothetical protein
VDVTEVTLQALAGVVGQRDEGLTAFTPLPANVAADMIVTTLVPCSSHSRRKTCMAVWRCWEARPHRQQGRRR